MDYIENLFNEDHLSENIKGAAYFILLYEHFEDMVIENVKGCFSDYCILDGKLMCSIDPDYIALCEEKSQGSNEQIPYTVLLRSAKRQAAAYKNEVTMRKYGKDLHVDLFRASLDWLAKKDVLSRRDVKELRRIRQRRNTIVHLLLNVLGEGLTEEDSTNIFCLLDYYLKVDNWFAQRNIIDDTIDDTSSAQSMAASTLVSIFKILFMNEGQQYKDAINTVKNVGRADS